jgi:GMP reductase
MENKIVYDFDDVMIVPTESHINSRKDVSLIKTFQFNGVNGEKIEWEGIPIIASNMDTIGTFRLHHELAKYRMLTALNKHYTLDDFRENQHLLAPDYFMVTTGTSEFDYDKLVEIVEYTHSKWICIDIANGYISSFFDFCCKVRNRFPNQIIVAGNVCTADITDKLLSSGINIVKVGIGSGLACLTRRQTGVGIPQFSAVVDCSKKGSIVSDGGIRSPGDVVKAFGGGADFVMIGGFFSGHDENNGVIVEDWVYDSSHQKKTLQKYQYFYGMSSKHAMEKYGEGQMKEYRSSEGDMLKVPYKGRIEDTVKDLLGGIRSACTYVNAENIGELKTNVTFVYRA